MADQIVFVEALTSALGAGSDGTYPVTLLTPGLGTTAFYSESVIKRDAPTAFPKGTHVYLTHNREANGEPNPEKLLGVLIQDTTIRESDGAAINRFKPVRRYADFVEDVHEFVGLSIAAGGTVTMGMMEGRQVKIAESIAYSRANSVDMVSYPGRVGSGFVESAFARYAEDVQTEPSASGSEENGNKMPITEEQFTELTESVAALATLVESALPKAPTAEVVDAAEDRKKAVAATRLVEAAEVPDEVKTTLIESIEAGNYEVEAEIAKVTTLRESLKTELVAEFKEAGHVIGAAGSNGSGEAPKVNGWAV